jgi:hypothetical protein
MMKKGARASLEFEGALFLLWFLTCSVQGKLILAREEGKSKKQRPVKEIQLLTSSL